jgi:hypothetical protein
VPDDENWEGLRKGGINGLFLVVMCLSWWAPTATSKKDKADFISAKDDVMWVFQQISEYLRKLRRGKKRAIEGGADDLPVKRSRRYL